MDAIPQPTPHHALPKLHLSRYVRLFARGDQPLKAGLLPVDAVEIGHRLNAAGDHLFAIGWRRVGEKAHLGVRRLFDHHVARDITHHEEGISQNRGVRLVTEEGGDRELACGVQRLHGSVLNLDLDVETRCLLGIESGLGILEAKHQLLLHGASRLSVGDGHEYRLGRETRPRQLESRDLELFHFGISVSEPFSKRHPQLVIRAHAPTALLRFDGLRTCEGSLARPCTVVSRFAPCSHNWVPCGSRRVHRPNPKRAWHDR